MRAGGLSHYLIIVEIMHILYTETKLLYNAFGRVHLT